MKQGTQQRTADVGGTKKFAPQFSFNSVQDLANLGDLVPLIFTNRQLVTVNGITDTYGGIRVNSQLLWSQMVSLGSYQQLKILALFSLGEIAKRPDLEGYAIGDLLLKNYHSEKIYKITYTGNEGYGPSGENIPFLPMGGIIPNDIFKIDSQRYFSGTRNPTTQAAFGLSNPMPNATAYKLPYELVRTASDISADRSRPAGRIALKKRRKEERWRRKRDAIARGDRRSFGGFLVDLGSGCVEVGTAWWHMLTAEQKKKAAKKCRSKKRSGIHKR